MTFGSESHLPEPSRHPPLRLKGLLAHRGSQPHCSDEYLPLLKCILQKAIFRL